MISASLRKAGTGLSQEAAREVEWLEACLADWRAACFPELILSGKAEPEHLAVVHGDRKWSHGALAQAVRGAARTLAGRHGVQPGDRVVMMMENSDRFIIAYLAIHLAGAVAVPFNTKLRRREIDYQITDCQPSLLISDAPLESALAQIRPEALLDVLPAEVDLPRVEPDAPATIFYTSGTTGAAKGVIHSHRTLIAGAFQNCRGWGYEMPGSVTLAMTPLFHIAAHSWFYPVLAIGGTLIVESFKTEVALDLIERHRVDGFGAVPAMLLMMLEHPDRAAFDLSSVRNIRFGASSMPPERIAELREAFPNAGLFHGMGQTESGGTISVLPDAFALRKLGSAGGPIPGVAVKIVDEAGACVPRGTAGEVLAQGPHVMVSYLNKPESSAETLAAGWLHTGDIGVMDEDGMITLVDRKKDMIVRGGENIYSTEVEHQLLLHEAVRECAIVGLPDRLLQEVVGAVIVTDDEADEALRASLLDFAGERLAPFKIPTRWFCTDVLPRTATGKIQKQAIREAAARGALPEF
ncbi:class I adenylate-forming enzyme family protein [Aquibaculum arenosum]|uniref:AMP-binding protein n=1 Tax=Aquibaculum arenosum TaxID=3032591 RepID=A0ABT5YQB9_9PROT|nr:AMP-binding protein [Fodinicurvata sp. CAU 1616]MDF2097094.1 AMP-binding protein [Fodinicurvata sp. CAU 1616]